MHNKSNTLKSGIAVCVALAVTTMISLPVHAGIANSKHDFRETGSSVTSTPIPGVTEICITCHVPHKPLVNVPLWAHLRTTQSYNLYNTNTYYTGTATYDTSPAALTNSKSRLCLSCHDGTVAIAGGVYITQTGPNDDRWMLYNDGAKVGGPGDPSDGLKGSHPIAVTYPTPSSDNFKDISADLDVKLESSKVQCTSCHNPHNKYSKMLVKSNADSALCLTCHDK